MNMMQWWVDVSRCGGRKSRCGEERYLMNKLYRNE
jgi:hypothetical protein